MPKKTKKSVSKKGSAKKSSLILKDLNRIATDIQKEGGYKEVCIKVAKIKRPDALKQAGKIYKSKKK